MPEHPIYGKRFFRGRARKYHDKQVATAAQLYRLFRPASVFDAGCGIGSFLAGFKALGVAHVAGCEAYGQPYVIPAVRGDVVAADLGEPLGKLLWAPDGWPDGAAIQTQHPKWDLALCVEVAEHVDKRKSHVLAENLAKLTGKTLVFTAAAPGQRGRGHINCRPQPAWIRTMRRAGLRYSARLTGKVIRALGEIGDPLNLSPNMMVFLKPEPDPNANL